MSDPSATLELAMQCHRAGDLHRAEALYQQILGADPDHPDARHLLGVVALQTGRADLAVEHIRRALQQRPDFAEAHGNLGSALQSLGRLDEAVACHRHALRLRPGHAEVHVNLGNVLKAQARLDEAAVCYQQALRLRPDLAVAHNNLGNVLTQQGRLDEAVACYRHALRLAPGYAEGHNNLGNALKGLGELEEAVACYRHALELAPNYAEAHSNLGNALEDLGRLDEAAACHRHALQLAPHYAEAHVNLGNLLKLQVRLDEAINCYRHALHLRPDLAVAHNNLGNALRDRGEIDEAIACYRRALQLAPDYAEAHSSLVFSLHYHPDYDAAAILREARDWHHRHAEPLAPSHRPHENDPAPDRRLRVGYVSPDFREHPAAFFLAPLLANHDRSQVEIYCYAGVTRPDGVTDRLRACAAAWRSTVGLADDSLADLIRSDRIDVLVDVTLHMAGGRLLVFARRPAPVQVTWLGYPGTTGLSAIDYRLTDPHLDAPGETDAHYAEQSVRLPETFWVYDPLTGEEPGVNPLPALDGGPFTFGSLNNFCKVNAASLALWAAVLGAVPGSRFLLLAPAGQARDWVRTQLERNGVGGERVVFVDRLPRPEYLRVYQQIDLGLDPLPYNGHTTSLDAAWMGVPTVTLAGRTVVGRAGRSLLCNLDLLELAAESPDEYVAIAAGWARDWRRLAELRSGLRGRMATSPLMDGTRFCRGLEATYRQVWRDWCGAMAAPAAQSPGKTKAATLRGQ
jgi:predicted O-linked N-acetylglucosamine transferase (SPINDLY family)